MLRWSTWEALETQSIKKLSALEKKMLRAEKRKS